MEENKQNNINSTNNKNTNKKNKNSKLKLIFKFVFIACVLFVIIFLIKNFNSKNTINTNKATIDQNTNVQTDLKEKNIEIELLKNQINQLENKIKIIVLDVDGLKTDIMKLENQNPANNEKNLQIVLFLNKIENIVYKGGDFSENLRFLMELAKSRNDILENVLKLKNFSKQKTQKELNTVFFNEYKNILNNNDKNNAENYTLKRFLNENIRVRKVNNFDEKEINSIDNIISQIENEINLFNYQEAIDIVQRNNYFNSFEETLKILNDKNNVIKLVNKIFDFIYLY